MEDEIRVDQFNAAFNTAMRELDHTRTGDITEIKEKTIEVLAATAEDHLKHKNKMGKKNGSQKKP
eukprot:5842406-Karenia_brevis.AAC.1